MNCKDCDAIISCAVHAGSNITEYEDLNDLPLYSCDSCVHEGMALGSIVHWCNDFFGMIGGEEQKGQKGDSRQTFNQKVFVIPTGREKE